MSKKFFVACVWALMLPIVSHAESIWNGGSVTDWAQDAQGRYLIYTADELAGLASQVNNGNSYSGATFLLMDDINLNDYHNWEPIGYANGMVATGTFEEKRYFSGIFDGQGHTISHYYVKESSSSIGATYSKLTVGLFGAIKDATIQNLVVRDSYAYIKTNHYSNAGGVIAGLSVNSTVRACISINNTVEVYAPYWAFGNLGTAYAGGIVGVSGEIDGNVSGFTVNSDSDVNDCVAVGNNITADGSIKNGGDNPTEIANGAAADGNNVYSTEADMVADTEAIARKNEKAIRENVVNNANPPHYLWSEETGMISNVAVFSLDTTPEIVGGGSLTVYAPNAVERSIDGVTYTTITNLDEIHVSGIEYVAPSMENNGYRMHYYKAYCGGAEVVHREATGTIEFDDVYTGATGNVTVQGVFTPYYLVSVETNGVSDAFVYGESTYAARENELVTITMLTDTINGNGSSYRYYTIKSITLNGSDVSDMVVPGNISTFEFAMSAMPAAIYVEFEETIYTSVEEVKAQSVRIYGTEGALVAIAPEPTTLVVNGVDGRVVYNATINGRTEINLPAGVYIANRRKVVVR